MSTTVEPAQGPRAAAIRVRRMRAVPGCMPACGQPSLVAVVETVLERDCDELLRVLARAVKPWLSDQAAPVRVAAGTHPLGAAIAALCTSILNRLGMPVFAETQVEPVGDTAFRIRLPVMTGLQAMAGSLVATMVRAIDQIASGGDAAASVAGVGRVASAMRPEAPGGKNTLAMLRVAHENGIPWSRMSANNYRFGQGARLRWFNSTISDRTPSIGVALAKRKDYAARLLRSRGLPVPEHFVVRGESEALEKAARIGYPVVVKPADQDRGIGVHALLRTPEQVARAYRDAAQHSDIVLVEKHFDGQDYRLFVFEGEVFRVRHRVPGSVTGNGTSTVEALLAEVNADPRRKPVGEFGELTRIELDEEARELLADQGLEPSSVPADGQWVRLRRIGNVSVGAVPHPVDVADVHPDNVQLAIRAVGALKLDLGAIDVLMPDIRRSWMETGAAICEVNSQPQWTADGAQWLYDRVFGVHKGRIPLVGVLASRTPAWVQDLQARAASAGVRLGLHTPDGTWVGATRILPAAQRGAFAGVSALIEDDGVDAIVFTADESLIDSGFPADRFDLLVMDEDAASQTQLAAMLKAMSGESLPAAQGGDRVAAFLFGA